MARRKPSVGSSRIINTVFHLKNRVIDLNNSKKGKEIYILNIQLIY
jgi:hypothetical protein